MVPVLTWRAEIVVLRTATSGRGQLAALLTISHRGTTIAFPESEVPDGSITHAKSE